MEAAVCEGPSHSQPRDVFDVLLQLEAQLQVLRLQPEVLFLGVLLSLRRGAGAASRRLREFHKGEENQRREVCLGGRAEGAGLKPLLEEEDEEEGRFRSGG